MTTGAARYPPGPTDHHASGEWASLYTVRAAARDPLAYVEECFERFGDIYHSMIGGAHVFHLRHPDHIQEVLVEKSAAFKKRPDLAPYLGKGLLTSDGDLWRRQRRLIQPAFHSERIAAYGSGMVAEARRLMKPWRPGEVRDVSAEMMKVTLGIVCRALFGHDVERESASVGQAMNIFQSAAGAVDMAARWLPQSANKGRELALRRMDAIIFEMIDARRSEAETEDDLLSWLLHATDAEGAMSRQQLRDELLTFYLAGHETTSQGLTWTWYLLSQHPGVETRLHAELDRVLGRRRRPSFEDLERLEFAGQVANEALRLYPPAYSLPRIAQTDVEIAGWTIPAKSEVVLCTYLCHRDPRWFPDPESFDPDRWLPDSGRVKHPLAFFPFGAGSRACIGKHFARMEMLLVIATIARKYRLRLAPDQEVVPSASITLHPRGGLQMIVERR